MSLPNVHPHILGRQEPVKPSFLDHKAWVATAVAVGVALGFAVMAATDVQPREMVKDVREDVRNVFEIIVRPGPS